MSRTQKYPADGGNFMTNFPIFMPYISWALSTLTIDFMSNFLSRCETSFDIIVAAPPEILFHYICPGFSNWKITKICFHHHECPSCVLWSPFNYWKLLVVWQKKKIKQMVWHDSILYPLLWNELNVVLW